MGLVSCSGSWVSARHAQGPGLEPQNHKNMKAEGNGYCLSSLVECILYGDGTLLCVHISFPLSLSSPHKYFLIILKTSHKNDFKDGIIICHTYTL